MAAELLLGEPLFPGDSGVDQLVEIIKVSSEQRDSCVLSVCPCVWFANSGRLFSGLAQSLLK